MYIYTHVSRDQEEPLWGTYTSISIYIGTDELMKRTTLWTRSHPHTIFHVSTPHKTKRYQIDIATYKAFCLVFEAPPQKAKTVNPTFLEAPLQKAGAYRK